MPDSITNLQKLIAFLNKLFQFESQDLDFGIYKILHYKRNEVKQFIDDLLVKKVKEQLEVFDKDVTEKIQNELNEIEKEDAVSSYLKAKSENPKEAEILYKYGKVRIDRYESLKKQLEESTELDNTEEVVYIQLTQFFSRYYDKGDFISKRRFGKSEKYVVPYNGEETHFYWANHDQYYIKSSEYFQKFSFKVPHSSGTLTVNFKLAEAKTELGNVKADENKYFILSEQAPELSNDELNIFFESRPLTEAEKNALSGNGKQDLLDEQAAQKLQSKLIKQTITIELWKQDDNGAALLLRKLHHYTRKNSYDFFIHKDLKGFFQRELDFYIKSELVKVDDLYVLESAQHFENIRHTFKLIKCFKNIADTIIEFLSQIEDFQKKLWEKKKFVLNTEWVITIDKLAQWLSKEVFEKTIAEVVKNEKQTKEWKELFGEEVLAKWKKLKPEDLKADETTWRKLPIDTVHFSNDFKTALLTELSQKINLEVESDGLIMKSDNYHGISLLQLKFKDQVKTFYLDPPYNAKSSEIVYKNSFKHASWNSLMSNGLSLTKDLLCEGGFLEVAIDDYEYKNLHQIIAGIYGDENFVSNIIVISNPRGRNDDKFFGTAHEYMIVYSKDVQRASIRNFPYTEEARKQYNKSDNISDFAETSFMRTGNNSNRIDRPNLFYPIYYSEETNTLSLEKENDSFVELLPINSSREEKTWRWGTDTFLKRYKTELYVRKLDDQFRVFKKRRVSTGSKPKTIWHDPRYDASANGIMVLRDLFGSNIPFSYPKALYTVYDALYTTTLEDDLVCDFFPGSATTFHAVQLLNKDEDGFRKCILIEQGEYTYTVILPRIKKVAYSFDWKEGKPQNMNGLGVFLKYHRLEQYEEALENIQFNASHETVQQALQLDMYMPKYFLNFETRGSNTHVNIASMQDPWDYKLHVWDGFTYDTQQAADLIETFSYLIGLHMQKYVERRHEGRRYVFVWGWHNDQKKSLVVWRSIKGWKEKDYDIDRLYLEEELKKFEYDNLYINGQATLLQKYQLTENVFKTRMIPS